MVKSQEGWNIISGPEGGGFWGCDDLGVLALATACKGPLGYS